MLPSVFIFVDMHINRHKYREWVPMGMMSGESAGKLRIRAIKLPRPTRGVAKSRNAMEGESPA